MADCRVCGAPYVVDSDARIQQRKHRLPTIADCKICGSVAGRVTLTWVDDTSHDENMVSLCQACAKIIRTAVFETWQRTIRERTSRRDVGDPEC